MTPGDAARPLHAAADRPFPLVEPEKPQNRMISRWFSVLCPEKRQNRMQTGLFLPRCQFCPPHWPGKMHQAIFHASLPVLPASFGPVECIRPFSCLPHVKRKTTSQRSRLPPFSQRKSSDTRRHFIRKNSADKIPPFFLKRLHRQKLHGTFSFSVSLASIAP